MVTVDFEQKSDSEGCILFFIIINNMYRSVIK